MTLRVDLRNCKESVTKATINSFELGCLSMVIQMGQITEDTYQEFYARCKVYWTMSGSKDWYTLDFDTLDSVKENRENDCLCFHFILI